MTTGQTPYADEDHEMQLKVEKLVSGLYVKIVEVKKKKNFYWCELVLTLCYLGFM